MKSAKVGLVHPTPQITAYLVNILKQANLFKPYEKGIYVGLTWK